MRFHSAICLLATVLIAQPPVARRSDHADMLHGVSIADPYRWLETSSPETTGWVRAQGNYARAYLDKLPGRTAFAERVKALSSVTTALGVVEVNGRLFFMRRNPDDNQPVLYWRDKGGEARVLLNPNLSSPKGISAIASWSPSPDGKWLAYGSSLAGSDWRVLRIRNVDTGHDLSESIEWSKFGSPVWTADSGGFYYNRFPRPAEKDRLTAPNHFAKLYHHRLSTLQEQDRLIHERPDQKEWSFEVEPLAGSRLLVVVHWGTRTQNLVYVLDLQDPKKAQELVTSFSASFVPIGYDGAEIYFHTTDAAQNGRVVAIDLRKPAKADWREVVPQAPALLNRAAVYAGRVYCEYLRDVRSELIIHSAKTGKRESVVRLPFVGAARWGFFPFLNVPSAAEAREVYYSIGGFAQPVSLMRLDPKSGESKPVFEVKLPFDPTAFETRQVFYRSKDGTRVPMFLSGRKGFGQTGDSPVLLFAYGGFNIPSLPQYSARNMAWMEMGGIFAVANIRGGNEYGEDWHKNGSLDKKQNVFDDFIAAAEWLTKERYTNGGKLAIIGGSNGGLLVGACLNQRPELFGAAVPSVGVMDMLRFDKFTVGAGWASDYGKPDNPKDFAVLLKYSPLHNIRKGTQYPPTLIMTADHDDRVVPLHSFKYAAQMQYAQEGKAPILLRIESDAGHGGGKPKSKLIEEGADVLAFLHHALHLP